MAEIRGTAGGRRRHRSVGIAAAAVLALSGLGLPSVALADLPVYGRDLANLRDAGSEGPSPGQLSQAWAFKSSTGDFTGTPVVAGGVLVAGNNGGWVYALDAVSGKVLWSKNAGQPINGSAAIDTQARGGAAVYVPVAE